MEELKQYRELLSSHEQNLLKEFFICLEGGGNIRIYYNRVLLTLTSKPYPILQILLENFYKSRVYISQIIASTLSNLLHENEEICTKRFINLLVNLPFQILEIENLKQNLLHRITQTPIMLEVELALISRRDPNLLCLFGELLEKKFLNWSGERLPSKESIFHEAHKYKRHFVPLICRQLKNYMLIQDVGIRNNVLILKVAEEFSIGTQTVDNIGNISKMLGLFDLTNTPADLHEIQKYFYADFQRLSLILNFLNKYPAIFKSFKVETLLKTIGVLELLYEQNIAASYEDTVCLIESTYRWQEQAPALACLRAQELETLTLYTALSLVYEIITNDNVDQLNAQKLQQLNTLLRQVRSLDTLCALIEDIFQVIFLRWEQVKHSSDECLNSMRTKGHKCSNFQSTDDDIDGYNYAEDATATCLSANAHATRHGFICRGPALQSICSFLKVYVTKKLHSEDYKLSTEHLQLRFQRIVDNIGEALWKFSILEKIDDSMHKTSGRDPQQRIDPEELLQLVQVHSNSVDKTSSDEDSLERCNYASLTRRKAKKRRRASFSGDPNTMQKGILFPEKMVSSVKEAKTRHEDPLERLQAHKFVTRLTDRSIIPKMLGTPENLAIMALALKNFNDVKNIIETFNLQNTPLNRELLFVEQQQQVKVKLSKIYGNYLQQEAAQYRSNIEEPLATVEQIKNVAAKGFEMSKIISVVDNFAQSHKIQQSNELKEHLIRLSGNGQYDFLEEYKERSLNAVIILDLIINLPLNREITSHLLTVIRRQQQINKTAMRDTSSGKQQLVQEKSQLPREIGPMTLLENLCECMCLLESNGSVQSKKSLNELICNSHYKLKPRKLEIQLIRERIFKKIYYKEPQQVGSWENLKVHGACFQHLNLIQKYYNRFCSYVVQLARILQLRNPNLVLHTTELLKYDPYSVIGELIYECNMTPLEIESNVSALNLNLVHVIALNICPEAAGKLHVDISQNIRKIMSQKQESIYNYIAQSNKLLAFLLRSVQLGNFADTTTAPEITKTYLVRLLELPALETLATLYNSNKVITALCADRLSMRAFEKLTDKRKQLDILLLVQGKRDPKNAQKKRTERLITELIESDSKNVPLVLHLHNISLRAQILQDNFTKISTTRLAKELIECTLQHNYSVRIPTSLRTRLENTLADITIYAKVSEVLIFETWPQAYDFGRKTPNAIFEKLLQLRLYQLCFEWCQVVHLAERFPSHRNIFLATFLNAILELDDQYDNECGLNIYLLKILESFPVSACVNFLDTHKDKFRSLKFLNYAIDFLIKHARNPISYKNYKVSLDLFTKLDRKERISLWSLLRHPLLIIEQLIMNAKFEILNEVIKAVRLSLKHDKSDLTLCPYCFDKSGNIYDIHSKNSSHKVRFQLGQNVDPSASSAFILLNFNLYQKNHIITDECIDLLLRIYATKALDYYISDTISSSSERISQTTDTQVSLDSLCGAFQMPKQAPKREEWVRDEEASHCMCCRRTAFTMLMRRHHCRRCGRVVCFACSTHRMRIPELYEEVEVRICIECFEHNNKDSGEHDSLFDNVVGVVLENPTSKQRIKYSCSWRWHLSGNITHDKLVREEFCYEHAPSVALSLSILSYHVGQQKCVDLLLYHCRKLEKLIVPNPEVDYELVAKMMNCLAVAAKVRGGPEEIESIREHAEIIMSVVQNGCEGLIPPGPLSNHSLRKLADSLVQAEHWSLALEVHLKCGFPTAGVMAAHGLACLRTGCYDTAREKFSHCMSRVSNMQVNGMLYKLLFNASLLDIDNNDNQNSNSGHEIPRVKRPQRGPPLLKEILKLISILPLTKPQPETLQRASLIRNSNSSLASLFSKRKEPYVVVAPLHEPALNVLNTLSNLKLIVKGNYGEEFVSEQHITPCSQSRNFEEAMHYVLTYGSHEDILHYLMSQQELVPALKYYLSQELETELFINNIFLISLRSGKLDALIEHMQNLDEGQLYLWRATLLQTCAYLEKQNHLNALYQLQLLLKDPIRASMTCVKFYTMNCESFDQLHLNAQHLRNAHLHLQTELELSQWENINLEQYHQKSSRTSARRSSNISIVTSLGASFAMQLDARALNRHINTTLRQLEVAKFLSECEKIHKSTENGPITIHILKQIQLEPQRATLPTLFDSTQDKIQLCILILLCGRNIDEGFGLAYRIIQDYKLVTMKVFGATSKFLARNQRLPEVEKLINCITSNNGTSSRDIDELLSIAINSAVDTHEPEVKSALDNLAKKIINVELRISSHIFIGQLKSAYLLANKYERLADIRKILRQAELTNQLHIKKLCEKKLNINTTQVLSEAKPPL